MVGKSPQAFRTISEVADIIDVPAHVLRFWESKFSQIKPVKRGGGRRYYRPTDVHLIRGIRDLLYSDGLTIKGAQKVLRDNGVKHVAALGEQAIAGNAPTGTNGDSPVAVDEAKAKPSDQPDTTKDPAKPAGDIESVAQQAADKTRFDGPSLVKQDPDPPFLGEVKEPVRDTALPRNTILEDDDDFDHDQQPNLFSSRRGPPERGEVEQTSSDDNLILDDDLSQDDEAETVNEFALPEFSAEPADDDTSAGDRAAAARKGQLNDIYGRLQNLRSRMTDG